MSRISRKIFSAVIVSVTVIMVGFMVFLEYRHYDNSVALMRSGQQLITEGQAILLSQYFRDDDEENMHLVLTGILANPTIVGVKVLDQSGQTKISIGETNKTGSTHVYAHAITNFTGESVMRLGEIKTYASDNFIIESIMERTSFLAAMAILVVLAVVLSVAFAVREIVERPIQLLMAAFGRDTGSSPRELVWKTNDEMGLLIGHFNQLNSRNFDVFHGMETELRDNATMEAERLRCLTDAAFEGIVIQKDGVILDMNEAACALLGARRSQAIGCNLSQWLTIDSRLAGKSTDNSTRPFLQFKIRSGTSFERTLEVSCRDIDYRGSNAEVVAIRDVTERINSLKRIEFLAHRDHLTGISNRFKFNQDLQALISGAASGCWTGAVMCLDLDGFKGINDFSGHASGDNVLVQVASRLNASVRNQDTVARLGGDEFSVALCGPISEGDAERIASKLVHELGNPYFVEGLEFKIGVSIGVAFHSDTSQSADHLLKQADMALYEAKRAGKGMYQLYQPHMEARRLRSLDVEKRLRHALRIKQLKIHFQPQADTYTGAVVGFEALARWDDDVLGTVSPEEFIATAEQTGLIVQLGEFVLSESCKIAALWPGHYRVAVNVSPAEFMNPSFVAGVRRCLEESGLEPTRLELEITENALMRDEELAIQSINELKELGVRVALDDFGTGYSSLSFLRKYPIDRIKIDKSFIRCMQLEAEAGLIVRSIINLGKSLNIGVIAEGVETISDMHLLQSERCGEVQGFYVGAATPPNELDKFFSEECADVQLAG